jgi:multidrug efflux pump subunit AcrA (membrane-fusion protein)
MTRKTITTIALLIVALAIFGCRKPSVQTQTSTQAPPPLPKDVQAVAPVATAATTQATSDAGVAAQETGGGAIAATGEFVSPVRSELSAKLPGRVAAVYVDEGSRVSKGQPVLELETDYVRLNLQRAEADAARAKAMIDDARRDVERK